MSKTLALSHETRRFGRPVLLAARISDVLSLRRQRARLARLDTAALADIGLTRHEAKAEANRPIWDVPQSWLR